jgi:hypothetical protein
MTEMRKVSWFLDLIHIDSRQRGEPRLVIPNLNASRARGRLASANILILEKTTNMRRGRGLNEENERIIEAVGVLSIAKWWGSAPDGSSELTGTQRL